VEVNVAESVDEFAEDGVSPHFVLEMEEQT
jgi:hypothetical protein